MGKPKKPLFCEQGLSFFAVGSIFARNYASFFTCMGYNKGGWSSAKGRFTMPVYSTANIPAYDFHAINATVQAHIQEYGDALRSYIVFGQLVETGESNTIEILEVIEGWDGPRRASFASTKELPLSGRLTIYFLRPEEFEHPASELMFGVNFSALNLLYRVERAYTILTELPASYARNVMERFNITQGSPLSLAGLSKV